LTVGPRQIDRPLNDPMATSSPRWPLGRDSRRCRTEGPAQEAGPKLGTGIRTLYKLIHGRELGPQGGPVMRVRKVTLRQPLETHVIAPGTLGQLLPPFESDGEEPAR
jgi:hypothetical protein